MNEFGIHILRFTYDQVLKDMFSVMMTIENYIEKFERHTPNPSQEGS